MRLMNVRGWKWRNPPPPLTPHHHLSFFRLVLK